MDRQILSQFFTSSGFKLTATWTNESSPRRHFSQLVLVSVDQKARRPRTQTGPLSQGQSQVGWKVSRRPTLHGQSQWGLEFGVDLAQIIWVLKKNLERNTSIHDGPGDSILDLGIDGGLHFRELTSSYAIPMLCPLYFFKISFKEAQY